MHAAGWPERLLSCRRNGWPVLDPKAQGRGQNGPMSDEETPSDKDIEDSWSRWEYPTLLALARHEQNDQSRQFISRDEVTQMVAPDPDQAWKVGRALHRLNEAGYIKVLDVMDGSPWPAMVEGLTPIGWRRAGVWPNAETFQQELLRKLEAAAEQISLDQPAKASKVKEATKVLGGVAEDVFAKVMTELISKAAGL